MFQTPTCLLRKTPRSQPAFGNDSEREHFVGIMTGRREGNPEGTLYGEVIVFTGTIGIPHWKAEAIAAALSFSG